MCVEKLLKHLVGKLDLTARQTRGHPSMLTFSIFTAAIFTDNDKI